MSIEIGDGDPGEADALHAVYVPAFDEPAEVSERWRDESLPRHAVRDGFRLVTARDGGRVVGFGYGYTGAYGQWWTDQVASAISPELAAEWLGGHFEFVELALLPSHERRGIGTALHDALLRGLPHRVALLTATADGTSPARRLYRRRGWQLLHDRAFDDAVLLGKRLNGRVPAGR